MRGHPLYSKTCLQGTLYTVKPVFKGHSDERTPSDQGVFSQNDVGGHSIPELACWTSDYWVAGSNPLRGVFRQQFHLIVPCACWAQFSLHDVHKGGL